MKIKIYKMSGAGNLFTVIDNRELRLPMSKVAELTPKLTSKSELSNYQCEGLMLLENSTDPTIDFKCEFFNPDGTTGMMCGNGGRAIAHFAKENNAVDKDKKSVIFEMAGDIYTAQYKEDTINLTLPKPIEIKSQLNISTDYTKINGTYLDLGSDHFVIEISELSTLNIKNIEELDINKYAPAIRYNSAFPNGCNANFIELRADEKGNYIKLRTYERGVEAETGACGTGAISSAIHTALSRNWNFPIRISPTSGQELIINCIGNFPDNIQNMTLEGRAEILEEQIIKI